MWFSLPFGSSPMRFRVADGSGGSRSAGSMPPPVVLQAPGLAPVFSIDEAIATALAAPIGAAPLEALAGAGDRVLVIVSDTSRVEPRDQLVRAVLARLHPEARLSLAIATGTHGPCSWEGLGLGNDLRARLQEVIVHDGHSEVDLVAVGTTARGTPVRVHRAAVDADLIVGLGVIKPHYFAGYGAGVKALFPGLGGNHGIRVNHQLKNDRRSVPGAADDNPCRLDLEDAAVLVGTPMVVVNLVASPDGKWLGCVYGDAVKAHRVGAAQSRRAHQVSVARFPTVIASDTLPITGSLYQASKIVAAVAPILADGGTIILVAECAQGIEPVHVVNELIYRLGIHPRLPPSHRVRLVSSLPDAVVRQSYCEPFSTIEAATHDCAGPFAVVPRASSIIFQPQEMA